MEFNVNVNLKGYIDGYEGSINDLIADLQKELNEMLGATANIQMTENVKDEDIWEIINEYR